MGQRGRPGPTTEKLEAIRQCISDGWTLKQIQETHRVSHATLKKHFPDYKGTGRREGQSDPTSEKLESIRQCISDGWSILQIKETYKISYASLKRHFPDYRGLGQRGRPGPTVEKLEVIRQCISDEWPLQQIQETYRISHATLKKHFPDYNGLGQREAGAISSASRKLNRKVSA